MNLRYFAGILLSLVVTKPSVVRRVRREGRSQWGTRTGILPLLLVVLVAVSSLGCVARRSMMRIHGVFAWFLVASVTVTLIPLGCGGTREDYVVVSRPTTPAPEPPRQEARIPDVTRRQLTACLDRRAGQWPESSYAVQYDAKATDRGKVLEVKLRDTTLHDTEVEGCLRKAIAAMTVPKEVLRLRSSGPVSGGERMTREQRGPLGSSDSENPIVFFGPFIVEAIGTEVIFEVGFMLIAAVATIVDTDEDDTAEYCQKHYKNCLMTSIADGKGSVHGETRCEWRRQDCIKHGAWPSWVVDMAQRKHSCK